MKYSTHFHIMQKLKEKIFPTAFFDVLHLHLEIGFFLSNFPCYQGGSFPFPHVYICWRRHPGYFKLGFPKGRTVKKFWRILPFYELTNFFLLLHQLFVDASENLNTLYFIFSERKKINTKVYWDFFLNVGRFPHIYIYI